MRTIIAFYTERNFAEEAFRELEKNNYSPETLTVLQKKREDVVVTSGHATSHMLHAAGAGIIIGAVMGGILGALVALGTLPIPGFENILFGRYLINGLHLPALWYLIISSGISLGIAVGAFAALIGLTLPEEKSHVSEDRIKEEGILLALVASDSRRIVEAKNILERHNPEQIRTLSFSEHDLEKEMEIEHNGHGNFPEKVHVLDIKN